MGSLVAVAIRPQVCGDCGRELPPARGRGRPRKWCDERCRGRARAHRAALVGLPWPPIAPAGYPTDPETVRRRTAEALVAILEGQVPAPAEDQLAQGLLELDWIAYRLAALEIELPRRLAGRTGELAHRIREAKAALFPELAEVSHR